MSRYANSWTGKSQFYRGKAKKLPKASQDREYQAYCDKKQNKDKILSYTEWAKNERRKHGMF